MDVGFGFRFRVRVRVRVWVRVRVRVRVRVWTWQRTAKAVRRKPALFAHLADLRRPQIVRAHEVVLG